MRCHNAYNRDDDHLAAGEIGKVRRGSYVTRNGELVGHWVIKFSRGRTVTLSCDASAESVTARFLIDSDGENFRRL